MRKDTVPASDPNVYFRDSMGNNYRIVVGKVRHFSFGTTNKDLTAWVFRMIRQNTSQIWLVYRRSKSMRWHFLSSIWAAWGIAAVLHCTALRIVIVFYMGICCGCVKDKFTSHDKSLAAAHILFMLLMAQRECKGRYNANPRLGRPHCFLPIQL